MMGRLLDRQQLFARNVARLIEHIYSKGYEISLGEVYRTEYQQREYVRTGLSKTMASRHRDKLAIDINLFLGDQLQGKTAHAQFGAFWKSLTPENRWGGDWGWDANHYEMTP
jgi:hypothetical protein